MALSWTRRSCRLEFFEKALPRERGRLAYPIRADECPFAGGSVVLADVRVGVAASNGLSLGVGRAQGSPLVWPPLRRAAGHAYAIGGIASRSVDATDFRPRSANDPPAMMQ